MAELLLIPAWGRTPRPLDDWTAALGRRGTAAVLRDDGPDGAFVRIETPSAQGYAELTPAREVSALNLECDDAELDRLDPLLQELAMELGYEVHLDEEDELEDD
jgi:hypothetical protein